MKWLAEVGQPIRRGQPLVEVETDKSILVLESAVTGTLQAINVSAGGEVAAGQVIATFAVDGRTAARAGRAWRRRESADGKSSAVGAASLRRNARDPRRVPRDVSFFERNRQARAESSRLQALPPSTRASSCWICTGGWS